MSLEYTEFIKAAQYVNEHRMEIQAKRDETQEILGQSGFETEMLRRSLRDCLIDSLALNAGGTNKLFLTRFLYAVVNTKEFYGGNS